MNKLFLIIMFLHVNPLVGTSQEPADRQPVILPDCEDAKMVLYLSRITDLAKWERENLGRDYEKIDPHIYYNLSSIPRAKLATWLLENNKNINFDESATAITCMHEIPDIGLFNLGTVKSVMTFGEIKSMLAARGTPLEDSCENYVELKFDRSNNIDIIKATSFDAKKHYHTMALFMAIGRSIADTTEFTFHKAIYQGKDVIVIQVTGTPTSYYDFSQYPI